VLAPARTGALALRFFGPLAVGCSLVPGEGTHVCEWLEKLVGGVRFMVVREYVP
jgi:hypothetical protein